MDHESSIFNLKYHIIIEKYFYFQNILQMLLHILEDFYFCFYILYSSISFSTSSNNTLYLSYFVSLYYDSESVFSSQKAILLFDS